MNYLIRLIPVLCVGLVLYGCSSAQQETENNDVMPMVQQEVQQETETEKNANNPTEEENNKPISAENPSEEVKEVDEPAEEVKEAPITEEPSAEPQIPEETAAEEEISAETEPVETTESGYNDGTYEGRALGYNANITVSVTISDNTITDITVLSHAEDDPYWTSCQKILDAIRTSNSTDVDAVSGATYTSAGMIGAVEDALAKAKK